MNRNFNDRTIEFFKKNYPPTEEQYNHMISFYKETIDHYSSLLQESDSKVEELELKLKNRDSKIEELKTKKSYLKKAPIY